MKENFLVDLSKQFAIDIVNLCTDIKENRKSNALLNQVLRSGTSIGANIHEANYAASKAAECSDILLLTASYEKTGQSETMISRLSQLAIIDMLFLGLIQRNYAQYSRMIEKQNTTIVPLFFDRR